MTAQVALGRAGIVLGLEVSRLARNNADWYRLLDLCSVTDTLIGDADGIYHPGLFNDRLVLGLKGTMSEAELHVLRARLNGGIRNKAARGELRRGLPIGFVWGDEDGEIRFHPDESVTDAIRAVFDRFAEMGSARRVWLYFRSEGLRFPSQRFPSLSQRTPSMASSWVTPTYTKIHQVLTNPVYAGAYVYGKSRHERFVDGDGNVRTRVRKLPRRRVGRAHSRSPRGVHRLGHLRSQPRAGSAQHAPAPPRACRRREGRRRAAPRHRVVRSLRPGLHAHTADAPAARATSARGTIVERTRRLCLRIGGRLIDEAVASALVGALQPAALEASLQVADRIHGDREAALAQ